MYVYARLASHRSITVIPSVTCLRLAPPTWTDCKFVSFILSTASVPYCNSVYSLNEESRFLSLDCELHYLVTQSGSVLSRYHGHRRVRSWPDLSRYFSYVLTGGCGAVFSVFRQTATSVTSMLLQRRTVVLPPWTTHFLSLFRQRVLLEVIKERVGFPEVS